MQNQTDTAASASESPHTGVARQQQRPTAIALLATAWLSLLFPPHAPLCAKGQQAVALMAISILCGGGALLGRALYEHTALRPEQR